MFICIIIGGTSQRWEPFSAYRPPHCRPTESSGPPIAVSATFSRRPQNRRLRWRRPGKKFSRADHPARERECLLQFYCLNLCEDNIYIYIYIYKHMWNKWMYRKEGIEINEQWMRKIQRDMSSSLPVIWCWLSAGMLPRSASRGAVRPLALWLLRGCLSVSRITADLLNHGPAYGCYSMVCYNLNGT